jgi:hypothetical protein
LIHDEKRNLGDVGDQRISSARSPIVAAHTGHDRLEPGHRRIPRRFFGTSKSIVSSGRCKPFKTVFLCRYLHSEALRREINEGLNVIEHWNGANDFVFFAKRGELASNRREDHEVRLF